MKKLYSIIIMCFFITALQAGVIKESKTKVSFGNFGTLSTKTTVQLEGLQKRSETQKKFESDSFMGEMMGGLMGGSGQSGEIISLEKMQRIHLDHPHKRYSVSPIEKINWDQFGGEEEAAQPGEEREQSEDHIKIIRSEFKVTDTGQQKKINRFPCHKYQITWVTEWLNTETGEKGKDSLVSVVWTTTADKELKKALEEEKKFNKLYMEKIGLSMDEMQSEMLGTQWMNMFRAMDKGASAPEIADQEELKELAKIKGYPIVTDGKFFISSNKKKMEPEEEQQEEETEITDVGGLFGGFVKKALEKKMKKKKKPQKSKGLQPNFSFYTELVNLRTGAVDPVVFEIPKGYKQLEK